MEEDPEITVSELKRLIDSGAHVNLIDVREPREFDLCHIEGSRLIPLSQIPAKVKEFNAEMEYVVYCHVGERSAFVVTYLRRLGFSKARSLKGGIDQWAAKIDASMPRY